MPTTCVLLADSMNPRQRLTFPFFFLIGHGSPPLAKLLPLPVRLAGLLLSIERLPDMRIRICRPARLWSEDIVGEVVLLPSELHEVS